MKLDEYDPGKIAKILDILHIDDYKILDDGTVDVYEHINLNRLPIDRLPVKFGHVEGYFDCEGCKNLSSLDNMPLRVGSYVDLRGCSRITSLIGFSTKIGGVMWVDWENIKSGGIGLILTGITGLAGTLSGPFLIIDDYCGRPEDIFECQSELIEAGYSEYTIL